MQRFTEHGLRGVHVLLVLILNRCACKAEKQSPGEGIFNSDEHIPKCAAVAFIHDKDDVLVLYHGKIHGPIAYFPIVHTAHLLNGGTASEAERQSVLAELHKSFASLSQEEQRFAVIFLHDVENGSVNMESGKTFKNYIIEYQTKAQNDSIRKVSNDFGIDENLLREVMNAHVTRDNLNEYNRFANLIDTADVEKVKTFFEHQTGEALSIFRVKRILDEYMRKYILEG